MVWMSLLILSSQSGDIDLRLKLAHPHGCDRQLEERTHMTDALADL